MRACFLGQNIFALGYGVATLQSPRLLQAGKLSEALAGPGKRDLLRALLARPGAGPRAVQWPPPIKSKPSSK